MSGPVTKENPHTTGGLKKTSSCPVMYVLGILATCISVAFVIYEVCRFKIWDDPTVFSSQFVLAILVGSLMYLFNGFVLALAWSNILGILGVNNPKTKVRISIFGRSQIARYIPGNVFHLVGRHTMITGVGVNHSKAATSTILEFSCILFAAFLISIVGSMYSDLRFDTDLSNVTITVIAATCVSGVALLAAFVFRKKIVAVYTSNKLDLSVSIVGLFKITLGYAVFFVISGGVLYLLLFSQDVPPTTVHYAAVITAIAMSWTIGFVTPGAPAGVGVREAALILLLTPSCGVETATLAAIAFRVCTTLGEFLLFVICTLFLPRAS